MHHADPATLTRQIERTRRVRQERDARRVQQALQRLEDVARSTDNIMPAMLAAVQAYATIGEICATLTHVFGLYSDPAVSVVSGTQGSGLASAQAQSAGPPNVSWSPSLASMGTTAAPRPWRCCCATPAWR